MTVLGLTFLVLGVAFIVAEAHVPGGILGIFGGVAVVAGGTVLVVAGSTSAAVVVPVVVALVVVAVGWSLLASRSAASVRGLRSRTGSDAMCGQVGVVRQWEEPVGRVFVEGALWRARRGWGEVEDEELHVGDAVVVENVHGLTLSVRPAQDWELVR